MTRLTTLILATCALSLSACDQIRLPGSEKTETPQTTTPASTDTAGATDETPDTVSTTTPVTTTPVSNPVSTPVTDLSAINAAVCGLPMRPVDDSLTIAEITGAQPVDADLVGIATINGEMASLANFPGLVKMEPREFLSGGSIASGHCGATRIAANWFITAAHCLDGDYDEVLLVVGAENLQSPLAKRVSARASLCHASYGGAGNNFVNDIALVRVEDASLADLSDLPIARYGATDKTLVPFNYAQARMAGWGLTSFNGSLSNDLLTATLTMTGTGPAAIGVESLDGSGPCVGDSGGPLFVSEADGSQTVVGVLSVVEQNLDTRKFCEGTYGARYTNLQGYENWIKDVITACDNGNGLCGF